MKLVANHIISDLGIVINDFTEVFLERSTYLPIKKTKTYAIAVDDSNSISCSIFERESEKDKYNKQLGHFIFNTTYFTNEGFVNIDITFEVSYDGLLTVTAKEHETDNEMSIVVPNALMTSDKRYKEERRKRNENSDLVLGIDLGSSYSAACVYKDGKTIMIPSAEGATMYRRAFPSYVAFTEDGEILVGEPARKQAQTNPKGTVSAIKRRMGTDYTFNIRGKEYTPQEISAMILKKIKKDSEVFLGETIEKAVITVPAYFDDKQRTATKDAAEIAGIEVIRLLSEPTAASIAYGIDKHDGDDDINILVFDAGGGTLDVTIMEFGGGIFEVLSASGDTNLGGIDMDSRLMQYLADEFKDEHGIDLLSDPDTERRLREAAERAKIELSTTIQTDINLPFIALGPDGKPLNLNTTLNRSKFESLVKPIVDRCGGVIDKALECAYLTVDDIDKIVFVGKTTRLPIVQKYVEEYIGKEAERGIDPEECVAQGAAILGSIPRIIIY